MPAMFLGDRLRMWKPAVWFTWLALCACRVSGGATRAVDMRSLAFPNISALCPAASCNITLVANTSTPIAIVGGGPAPNGIFDPSMQYGNGSVVISYSVVSATNDIHTSVAIWNTSNMDWELASVANQVEYNVTFACPGGFCTGNMVHEVSSIIFDANDPIPERRWKIFAHSYMVTNITDLHYDWGYISLMSAPSIFSDKPWLSDALLGWQSSVNFSSAGVQQNLSDFPELADCIAFSEPGAVVVPNCGDGQSQDCIVLALGCVFIDPILKVVAIRVVALKSLDHAASFSYMSVLLSADDMLVLNFTVPQVNAADLFWDAADQSLYLIVSPAVQFNADFSGYLGCMVFPLTPSNGTFAVHRDPVTSAPELSRLLLPSPVAFSGACTAIPPHIGGAVIKGDVPEQYLMPTLFPAEVPSFRILPSGTRAP